ncbi:ankyrin repeat domain-containing protein [Paraburkholderia strydomiana]|uniref:ankyrin repeat domain-containing protein n=1 Tax=Paraburkholderia strydomiana TaxID=1245417 RepID=UPI002035995A|nr:ankyrin repeat domain-containing protein [Paraburkholderia strydomiana]
MLPFLFVLSACAKAPERSPLGLAAEQGDLAKVQQQVNDGADISAKDDKGLDALCYAIINERPKVVEYLVARGANANTENGSGITAMIIAATVGDLAIVDALHKHGADINRATKDGITPLMAAAASDNTETAALLLSYGADPCMRDKNHLTARQTADQWRGIAETARVIRRNKALAALDCTGVNR